MPSIGWIHGARYTRSLTGGLVKIEGYGVRRLLEWIRITGAVPTHAGADALAHILFLKHERPSIYERTHKLLEPMDYLNLRLTGRFSASYATIFPYLLTDNRDVTDVHYDDRLLGLSGVDRAKLPDLVPVDAVLGTLLPTWPAIGAFRPAHKSSPARPTIRRPPWGPARSKTGTVIFPSGPRLG